MPPQESTGIESLIEGVRLDDPVERFSNRWLPSTIGNNGFKERKWWWGALIIVLLSIAAFTVYNNYASLSFVQRAFSLL
jgi:hypothetical protein